MRTIQASAAKTHLPQLLDEVEHGATLVITRHGKPIARIIPEQDGRQNKVNQAIARIKARRREIGHVTVEELLSARDEGRR